MHVSPLLLRQAGRSNVVRTRRAGVVSTQANAASLAMRARFAQSPARDLTHNVAQASALQLSLAARRAATRRGYQDDVPSEIAHLLEVQSRPSALPNPTGECQSAQCKSVHMPAKTHSCHRMATPVPTPRQHCTSCADAAIISATQNALGLAAQSRSPSKPHAVLALHCIRAAPPERPPSQSAAR